ncbi:hypothetical protein SAMN05444411_1251 [Lutibacter oricola]|uniref:Uncharacterized protein n=1 Tax=Lutibacter oricola TaxID=762486 RepID=A0A1H3H3Q4_9FLAO|nr:hypothetical protein [Lutibacter oricola]SDY10027.1 hypothetical protein SAMN05444411_1251 [Lutibacter oricola]
MKLFPTKEFTAELRSDFSISKENLKLETDITDSLVSDWTNKEFRGQVYDNGFKLISSEIGIGAVCVLDGKFNGKVGEIEIRIHKAFKVMFSILMLMPFSIFLFEIITNGIKDSIGLIVPATMGIVFGRFVLIEFSFRYISKIGIDKLTDILTIKDLKKI